MQPGVKNQYFEDCISGRCIHPISMHLEVLVLFLTLVALTPGELGVVLGVQKAQATACSKPRRIMAAGALRATRAVVV